MSRHAGVTFFSSMLDASKIFPYAVRYRCV